MAAWGAANHALPRASLNRRKLHNLMKLMSLVEFDAWLGIWRAARKLARVIWKDAVCAFTPSVSELRAAILEMRLDRPSRAISRRIESVTLLPVDFDIQIRLAALDEVVPLL